LEAVQLTLQRFLVSHTLGRRKIVSASRASCGHLAGPLFEGSFAVQ